MHISIGQKRKFPFLDFIFVKFNVDNQHFFVFYDRIDLLQGRPLISPVKSELGEFQ